MISNQKMIQKIEPFNDIYYRNCFYNSFFPIIKHFGENIFSFMINDVMVYKQKEDHFITIDYLQVQAIEEILDSMNLQVKTKGNMQNVIEDVIHALSKEEPVILWVDCYYEPMRKDTYLKQHLAHTWLIYGYDKEQRLFNIIEHQKRENLSYGKYTINFEDLQQCYQGYQDHFESLGTDMFSFYKKQLESGSKKIFVGNSHYLVQLINNLKLNSIRIEQGLILLVNFFKWFEKIIFDEQELNENLSMIINTLTDIINGKLIEKYRLEKLNAKNLLLYHHLMQMIDDYMFIRANLARYQFSMRYKDSTFSELVEKTKNIMIFERKYLETLIQI